MSIHYLLRQNTNAKKTSCQQYICYKKFALFLGAPTHHSFTFDLLLLHELKHKAYLCETICGIFHFRFRLVFIIVYIFVQQEAGTFFKDNSHQIKVLDHTQFCSQTSDL